MKTINEYKVHIQKSGEKPMISLSESGNNIGKIEIIAENDQWIVINNRNFDKITKNKAFEFCYPRLEKPKVNVVMDDNCFGSYVTYTFYTHKTKTIKAIKKEIETYLKNKYGWLMGSFDLNIENITKKKA